MLPRNKSHEEGIDSIIQRLASSELDYDQPAMLNKRFGYNGTGCVGEIDVYATKGDRMLIFEYKTKDGEKQRKKAYQQLFFAKKHYEGDADRISTFYVHDGDVIEWITFEELGLNSKGYKLRIKSKQKSSVVKYIKPTWRLGCWEE